MGRNHLFWDRNQTQYELVKSGCGPFHFLLIPGGPGASSVYFYDLIETIDFPGSVWCIDFQGNGDDTVNDIDFGKWSNDFVYTVKQFPNPVVIGHSFGAMLPLLHPEMESLLKGYINLFSSPSLWFQKSIEVAKEKHIQLNLEAMDDYEKRPNRETFQKALIASAPLGFAKAFIPQGETFFAKIPFNFHASARWKEILTAMPFSAKWIPKQVPTLILGGEEDAINPPVMFAEDQRFHRPNIQHNLLKDAGHFGWIEKPKEVQTIIQSFIRLLA